MATKNKKRQRKSRTSSGKTRVAQARQELTRIRMKIARWKKNQTNDKKKTVWAKEQKPHTRSRHHGWDTRGLERRIKQLEAQIKQGPKRKNQKRVSLFD